MHLALIHFQFHGLILSSIDFPFQLHISGTAKDSARFSNAYINMVPLSVTPTCRSAIEYQVKQELTVSSRMDRYDTSFISQPELNGLSSVRQRFATQGKSSPLIDIICPKLDISKAFDRIWHEGLIYKLSRNGVSGKLLMLLTSFSLK